MLEIPDSFNQKLYQNECVYTPVIFNHRWIDWKLRFLRSMHIREDGSIISLGFPKFMNLGEGREGSKYRVTEDDVLKHVGSDLIATLKIDGSLLIRFVDEGEVRWRTRGACRVGLSNAWEIDMFCDQFPELADPNLYPDVSLLFEWVSPENKIVLTYNEPKIILIGGISFTQSVPWYDADPQLLGMDELDQIAGTLGVELVEYYSLQTEDDVSKLIENMKVNNEIEGFVLRFDDGQRMVKVKTEQYLILHALRSNLTTEKLIELWFQWEQPDFTRYQKKFAETYDWECWKWALSAVSSMFDGIKVVKKIYTHVKEFVEANRHEDRKTFALMSQERFNDINLSLCFSLLDGKEMSRENWKKLVLRNCKHFSISMFKDD